MQDSAGLYKGGHYKSGKVQGSAGLDKGGHYKSGKCKIVLG